MIVSSTDPFKLVFSLYHHEYLGYLLEPFVVKLTQKGELSFQAQNISGTNVKDFKNGLSKEQIKLVELTSKIQIDTVYKKFNSNKKLNREAFFKKVFDKNKPDVALKESIQMYVYNHKKDIYKGIKNELFYEMGSDGVPTWRKIDIVEQNAKVYFHFKREADKTIYYPIIKCGGEKVKFQFQGGHIINETPAVLMVHGKLYFFDSHIDGKKLKPFLNKPNIEIPKSIEDTYYKNFIVPLIANFKVYANGFDIQELPVDFKSQLVISEIKNTASSTIFDKNQPEEQSREIILDLNFIYGKYEFKLDNFSDKFYVYPQKTEESWIFYKIERDLEGEKKIVQLIKKLGLEIKNDKTVLPKRDALYWVAQNKTALEEANISLVQNASNLSSYFLGYSSINVDIEDKNDWFDIKTKVIFGEYSIPFQKVRTYILNNIKEFKLPNGEIAFIPEEWFAKYSDLFENLDINETDTSQLKKHFVGLVAQLHEEGLAKSVISKKLKALAQFDEINEVELPLHFNGELRPYQKAGYDWLHFLKENHLGGCLADDMGLGKTITTLAFLQKNKEVNPSHPSLLVLPTSLIYNWQKEAAKFAPDLRVLVHFGSNRNKDAEAFKFYDLIITSYGVLRMDIEFIRLFRFNYAVLDESQSIKNATSANFKAVMDLNTSNRLILTGTPLENSTLDLWSQMTFINPGLLGSLNSFKKKYQHLIEKQKDEDVLKSLTAKIKPFMLRRNKKQVAKDLPEKVESIVYCEMTEEQEKVYEETKSYVRNQIMSMQESGSLRSSSILILQGLSKLRQLANHPSMVVEDYLADSGKVNLVVEKIEEAVSEDSKTLIFSQFVKHLDLIAKELQKRNIPYLYLDGATKNRMDLVERFQNTNQELIFLISLKAGGVGLNLTAAENVFILDPWWNPAIEAQAVDRAHRIGQTQTVFSFKFITQNTIEEKILELQNSKKQLFEDLIVEEEGFFKSLSNEDILNLLD